MIRLLGQNPPWIARLGMSGVGALMVAGPIVFDLSSHGWPSLTILPLFVGGIMLALFSWLDLGL